MAAIIANGIVVNGSHYKLSLVNNTICGEMKEGAGCIAIRATNTSIVVALCPEGFHFDCVIKGVDSITPFLSADTQIDRQED